MIHFKKSWYDLNLLFLYLSVLFRGHPLLLVMGSVYRKKKSWLFEFRGNLQYIVRLKHLFTTKMKNKMLGQNR